MERILVHPTHAILITGVPGYPLPATIDCRRCSAHGVVTPYGTDNWRLDAPCAAFDVVVLSIGLCLSLEFDNIGDLGGLDGAVAVT